MANAQNMQALDFLGRRLERLIFGGVLLILLCLAESYLATAHKQIREDRNASLITSLLSRLESEEPQLKMLFQSKPDNSSTLTSAIPNAEKRQKAIRETRKKLGLPPPKAEVPLQKPATYGEELDSIVRELQSQYPERSTELTRYNHPATSPTDLINALKKQKEHLENAPTTVWGIQTPRLFLFQYAGLDYKFPYGFISSSLAIALAPLIVGWLGALTFTRQRELLMITSLDDYKLAFPHILNILPVNFQIIERLLKADTAKSRISRRKSNKIFTSIFRSFFVLLITLPLLIGFGYSVFQLFDFDKGFSLISYFGFLMAGIMMLQTFYLVVQEWIFLHEKEFYE